MRLSLVATALAASFAALAAASPGAAHHSFAVFFDSDRMITLTGEVTEFHFRNPHGTISLRTTGDQTDGLVEGETWRAETNAPVVLRRRGWRPDSLKAGDIVTITGWPARDGSNYMRMSQVLREDGSAVGTAAFGQSDD